MLVKAWDPLPLLVTVFLLFASLPAIFSQSPTCETFGSNPNHTLCKFPVLYFVILNARS
jgi:hypothetical protein